MAENIKINPPTRLNRDMGGGVTPQVPYFERQEARGEAATGFINLGTPGRQDLLKASPPSGSYILPADVISGLGEGNSLAGANIVQRMLATAPGGVPFFRTPRGGTNIPRPPAPYNPNNPYPGAEKTTYQPHAFGGIAVPHAPAVPHVGSTSTHMGIRPEHLHLKTGGAANKKPSIDDEPEDLSPDNDGNVPVILAGGEFSIPPDLVRDHPLLGRGDLSLGHRILDAWVLAERKKHIKTLQTLPPPKT